MEDFEDVKVKYIELACDLKDAVKKNDAKLVIEKLEQLQQQFDIIEKFVADFKEWCETNMALRVHDINPLEIIEEMDISMFSFVTGGRSNLLLVIIALGVDNFKQLNNYYTEYDKFDGNGRREAWIDLRRKKDIKDEARLIWIREMSRVLRGKYGSYPLLRFIDGEFYTAFTRLVSSVEIKNMVRSEG